MILAGINQRPNRVGRMPTMMQNLCQCLLIRVSTLAAASRNRGTVLAAAMTIATDASRRTP
jgi:hypothetical protein